MHRGDLRCIFAFLNLYFPVFSGDFFGFLPSLHLVFPSVYPSDAYAHFLPDFLPPATCSVPQIETDELDVIDRGNRLTPRQTIEHPEAAHEKCQQKRNAAADENDDGNPPQQLSGL